MNRRLLLVVSFYGLLCWGYVIAMQIANRDSVYWDLFWWLPGFRIDYFGEAAFVISLACAIIWALSPEPSKDHRP
jgi:hypothetical protein